MELTIFQAHILCMFLVSAFVLSLYLVPARVRALSRNNDEHVGIIYLVVIVYKSYYIYLYVYIINLLLFSYSKNTDIFVFTDCI